MEEQPIAIPSEKLLSFQKELAKRSILRLCEGIQKNLGIAPSEYGLLLQYEKAINFAFNPLVQHLFDGKPEIQMLSFKAEPSVYFKLTKHHDKISKLVFLYVGLNYVLIENTKSGMLMIYPYNPFEKP